MAETDEAKTARETIAVDTKVEVRTEFDRSWTNGFVVAEVKPTGFRLRRRSDNRLLPGVFPFDQVRHERRNLWWV